MGNKNSMEAQLNIEALRAGYDHSLNYWNDILREKFGYIYDENYQLKKANPTDGDASFTFINQKHYEALGDVVLEYIQELMRRKFSMQEVQLPLPDDVGTDYSGPHSNIFLSSNWGTSEKGLVLIQGAGAVRAGQWARSVCINDSLKTGSVIPFLEYAEREGFSVIVLNPNLNRDHSGGVVRHNESAERHCYYVWKKFISRVPGELYVVGHSCGGLCTVSLLDKLDKEFIQRVKAIALTDSVHFGVNQCSQEAQKYFAEVAVDWVASRAPLDEVVRGLETSINGCINVSSGHYRHEYTTGACYESIFKFFNYMVKEGVNPYIHTGYETEIMDTDNEQSNQEMHETPVQTMQEIHETPAIYNEDMHETPVQSTQEIQDTSDQYTEEMQDTPVEAAQEIHESMQIDQDPEP